MAPARRWDWLTAVLLFLMMQVSAARLVTTNWAKFLYFSETLAALGTILGLALGVSRFRRRGLFWLTIAYTLVVVPWQISSAADDKQLLDRLGRVGNILLVSLGQFMQRQPVKDPLFFVAFVALVFWLLSILAGFAVARHGSILVGIIPSGVIVLVIQVYANYQLHGSWWLGLYLLLALLLVGRSYYLENEKVWLERRVYVHDEAWPNIMGGLFTAVAAAILIAWVFPTSISSVQSATDAWSRMTRGIRDRLSNAVTSLNGPYGRPGTNFYGTSLSLGQDAAVGDTQVFSVKVLKPPDANPRYYWRGRVYDTYNNGQWSISSSSSLDFEPTSKNIQVANVQDHSEADLRFTLQFPIQSLIYAPGEPVWLDKPASVQVTPVEAGLSDILSWQAKTNIQSGGTYEVRSQIGNPNVEQLRASMNAYPQWVQERYLQVPDNIRAPIQQLAQKVTGGQDTPYDKAVAITAYLRANIQYSTTLPPVPEGRDPIQWVLFNYKKGFCNYYASAEVLMLRSVGVPARLAVGFAQGEYENGTYIVRRRDAHAWPEVFFPGLGWVEFEPTTSQNPLARYDPAAGNPGGVPAGRIARPLNEGEGPNFQLGQTPPTKPVTPFQKTPVARVLMVVLSIASAALVIYLLYRYRVMRLVPVYLDRAFIRTGISTPGWIRNWLHWNQLQPVEQAFAPVNWSLRWLGKPPPVHATHAERAATLKKLLPRAAEPIAAAASELETGLFTPGTPDVRRARRAGLMILVHYVRTRVAYFLGI